MLIRIPHFPSCTPPSIPPSAPRSPVPSPLSSLLSLSPSATISLVHTLPFLLPPTLYTPSRFQDLSSHAFLSSPSISLTSSLTAPTPFLILFLYPSILHPLISPPCFLPLQEVLSAWVPAIVTLLQGLQETLKMLPTLRPNSTCPPLILPGTHSSSSGSSSSSSNGSSSRSSSSSSSSSDLLEAMQWLALPALSLLLAVLLLVGYAVVHWRVCRGVWPWRGLGVLPVMTVNASVKASRASHSLHQQHRQARR